MTVLALLRYQVRWDIASYVTRGVVISEIAGVGPIGGGVLVALVGVSPLVTVLMV